MGWGGELPGFVRLAYESDEENKACRQLIMDSEVVIFGGCEDESYISPRLEETRLGKATGGKITIRYSERLYREAQWKWISPRGLLRKYKDHVRYRNCPVYLLCSGGYVASDFGLIKAYKNKMFKWGYFPKVYKYDIDRLMNEKGYDNPETGEKIPYILWAGRFLELKHPELAIMVAERLKSKDIPFHMDIIGGGDLEEYIKSEVREKKLESSVNILPFMKPDEVREYMKRADIYLFTSDRREGWGAVINESMNSGCAVIVGHMIGGSTYLIEDGVNGYIYDDRRRSDICDIAENLACNENLRKHVGIKAYETITDYWNPEYAASELFKMINELRDGGLKSEKGYTNKPCERDYPRSEARIRDEKLGFKKPKRV